MSYYLGADLGATKTHMLIVDASGRALGFGEGGPGNHETVGYDGMFQSMNDALAQALRVAGLEKSAITGAGFGVAGFDWPSEGQATRHVIERLALHAPYQFVNDTVPGLLAGSDEGWGVVVVSGTGSNCRGWDRERKREGRVTGHGILMGEGAGASELVHRCMQIIGYSWTRRLPETALATALVAYVGASDIEDLLRGYTTHEYRIGADAAQIIFEVAGMGDHAARELIRWAGSELGELANAVIRQLAFEELDFDVVLTGSMFQSGAVLIEPMRETIHKVAPGARLVHLGVPPVVGAVMLGMEAAGLTATTEIRRHMAETLSLHRNVSSRQA